LDKGKEIKYTEKEFAAHPDSPDSYRDYRGIKIFYTNIVTGTSYRLHCFHQYPALKSEFRITGISCKVLIKLW
jgi:hypothetical protein